MNNLGIQQHYHPKNHPIANTTITKSEGVKDLTESEAKCHIDDITGCRGERLWVRWLSKHSGYIEESTAYRGGRCIFYYDESF